MPPYTDADTVITAPPTARFPAVVPVPEPEPGRGSRVLWAAVCVGAWAIVLGLAAAAVLAWRVAILIMSMHG